VAVAGADAVLLEVVTHAARRAFECDGVLQLHLGALRDLSPRLLDRVGRDVGADAIGDEPQASGIARLLSALERDGALPRVVLYNANPRDNALFASIAGAFSRPGVASLVQWGPPWWFNDHEGGIRRQLDDLSAIGQLAGFVGMVTDSRSLLSMTRHELFRRALCDAIGSDVEAGRIPDDPALLAGIVEDVCCGNAVRFFGLADPAAA
jgi:glucuronate isomerase